MKKNITFLVCLMLLLFFMPAMVGAQLPGGTGTETALCKAGKVRVGNKCIAASEAGAACEAIGMVYNGGDTCSEPEPEPEEEGYELLNLPELEHFTIEEAEYSPNEINLVFAPKGTPNFYLHVRLYGGDGQNTVEAWCAGDETLCKAVGNGRDCPSISGGNPLSETVTIGLPAGGEHLWCYRG